MNLIQDNHSANSTYVIPYGLCEICSDISREVMRLQPQNLYKFILEHVRTLLITRESTQVAIILVNNVLKECKMVLDVLQTAGLTLEQIFDTMPRIQKAFLEYVNAIRKGEGKIGKDEVYEEEFDRTVQHILNTTGAKHKTVSDAAKLIRNAFHLRYERMVVDEIQGKLFLRQSLGNILNILRRAGANHTDISHAVHSLQHTYSSLYIRRNMINFMHADVAAHLVINRSDSKETIEQNSRLIQAMQAVTWLKTVYKDIQWATERCNTAANVIQRAYREHRLRKSFSDLEQETPITSVIVNAIFKDLFEKVFNKAL